MWTARKRGKSVGKRVQHTPPTGTTLTEFRRFLNTDFGTLRMNAKSTHTFAPLTPNCKRGKTPGTQVQHTLTIGTRGTEFRHFSAPNCGTIQAIIKSARTFAPLTPNCPNALI